MWKHQKNGFLKRWTVRTVWTELRVQTVLLFSVDGFTRSHLLQRCRGPSSVKDFIKVQSYELCGPEGVWHTGFYLVEPQVQLIWTDEWKCARCWNRVDSFCSLQPLIGDCNTFHFNLVVHQMENPTWTWKLSVWVSIWDWRRGELEFYTGVITGNCRVQLRPQCQTLLLS